MIAFFVDIFNISVFGAIPDMVEEFEFAFDGNAFLVFMELIQDISQEVASRGKRVVGDVGGKLSVRFGQVSGKINLEKE